MIIKLSKFGTILISRPDGKEAYLLLQRTLQDIKENEKIEIDFDGISTLSPGWGDEVLTPLFNAFGERLILRPIGSSHVRYTAKNNRQRV